MAETKSTTVQSKKAASTQQAPKQPQDHKPKQDKPVSEHVDGGFNVKIDGLELFIEEDALNDFETMDYMARAEEENNPAYLPRVLRGLVGSDYSRVMDHLRDPETGRVTVVRGAEFVQGIFGALNPNS